MPEITWITNKLALSIHHRQLAEHGGLDGVRDQGMLESALARPQQLFSYTKPKPSIAKLAGAYAFAIAHNHPFVDGNKRTAYVACRTFLLLNGHDITASLDERYHVFMKMAAGAMPEDQFVQWLQDNVASTD